MKPPYEDLSRLREGELPPDEARALRLRIDHEPDVARARLELDALADALAALPETPPPAALDARVLGVGPAPVRRARWGWAVAAAAILAFASWPADRADRITLVEGQQLVDGDLELLAGDVPIAIDGMVRVTVEPAHPLARGPQGEDEMKVVAGTAAGAVAGVVVTVAVLSGSATVTPTNGEPVTLEGGEVRTFRPAVAHGASPGTHPVAAGAEVRPEDEIAVLREKLAQAEFAAAVAQGQVAATQGEAVPWPANVPEAYRPDAFEAHVREALAAFPGVQVHEVDCSEFPCILTVTGIAADEDHQVQVEGVRNALTVGPYADSELWMGVTHSETDEGAALSVGIALRPEGATADDEAVQVRTDWRGRQLLDAIGGP